MSGNFVANNCRLVGTHLTTTSNTAVFTATGYSQVIGLWLGNITAVNATATVKYFSNAAASEYVILFQHTVRGNYGLWVPTEAFSLNASDEIRVQAGTANAIDVIVSVAEIPGRSG